MSDMVAVQVREPGTSGGSSPPEKATLVAGRDPMVGVRSQSSARLSASRASQAGDMAGSFGLISNYPLLQSASVRKLRRRLPRSQLHTRSRATPNLAISSSLMSKDSSGWASSSLRDVPGAPCRIKITSADPRLGGAGKAEARSGRFPFPSFPKASLSFKNGLPNASIAFKKLQKISANLDLSMGYGRNPRLRPEKISARRRPAGAASERPALGPREGLTSAAFCNLTSFNRSSSAPSCALCLFSRTYIGLRAAGAGGGSNSVRLLPGRAISISFLSFPKGFPFLPNGLPNASFPFQKLQKVAKNFREFGLINGLRAAPGGKNFRRRTPGRASERPAPGPRET